MISSKVGWEQTEFKILKILNFFEIFWNFWIFWKFCNSGGWSRLKLGGGRQNSKLRLLCPGTREQKWMKVLSFILIVSGCKFWSCRLIIIWWRIVFYFFSPSTESVYAQIMHKLCTNMHTLCTNYAQVCTNYVQICTNMHNVSVSQICKNFHL